MYCQPLKMNNTSKIGGPLILRLFGFLIDNQACKVTLFFKSRSNILGAYY